MTDISNPQMGELIVKQDTQKGLTETQIDLLKRTICKGATKDELELAINISNRTQLDPFTNQIHFIKRRNYNKQAEQWEEKMVVTIGIDGFRSIADRTGTYAGSDEPLFQYNTKDQIIKATVTVYKMVSGQRCPFTASARWDEYCPEEKSAMMWRKMPHVMLGKVAEALALRKAFPFQLSGLYAPEEMAKGESYTTKPETRDADFRSFNRVADDDLPPIEKTGTKAEPENKGNAEELKKRIVDLLLAIAGPDAEQISRTLIEATEFRREDGSVTGGIDSPERLSYVVKKDKKMSQAQFAYNKLRDMALAKGIEINE